MLWFLYFGGMIILGLYFIIFGFGINIDKALKQSWSDSNDNGETIFILCICALLWFFVFPIYLFVRLLMFGSKRRTARIEKFEKQEKIRLEIQSEVEKFMRDELEKELK